MSYDDRDGCSGGEDGNGNGNSAVDVVVAHIEPACLKLKRYPHRVLFARKSNATLIDPLFLRLRRNAT